MQNDSVIERTLFLHNNETGRHVLWSKVGYNWNNYFEFPKWITFSTVGVHTICFWIFRYAKSMNFRRICKCFANILGLALKKLFSMFCPFLHNQFVVFVTDRFYIVRLNYVKIVPEKEKWHFVVETFLKYYQLHISRSFGCKLLHIWALKNDLFHFLFY